MKVLTAWLENIRYLQTPSELRETHLSTTTLTGRPGLTTGLIGSCVQIHPHGRQPGKYQSDVNFRQNGHRPGKTMDWHKTAGARTARICYANLAPGIPAGQKCAMRKHAWRNPCRVHQDPLTSPLGQDRQGAAVKFPGMLRDGKNAQGIQVTADSAASAQSPVVIGKQVSDIRRVS